MRVLLLVLALTVACAGAALAADVSTSTSESSTTIQSGTSQPGGVGQGPAAGSGISSSGTSVPASVGTGAAIGNQMVDTCMMNTFGLTSSQIQDLRSQGLSNSDIAMAAAISARSGQPISTVVTSWKAVGNWPDVARQYGVSMSNLTSASALANPDEEAFNSAFVSQYYGLSSSDIASLRQQGYTWSQINMMANAAARTGQPISQIAAMRAQGCTWSDIAARYNVAAASITQPVACNAVTAAAPGAMYPSGMAAGPSGFATGPTSAMCTGSYSATVGAGPAAFGSVPTPIVGMEPVMYDAAGNVILTMSDVVGYYSMGYSWVDVAIAANIYRETGYPIRNILMERRTGTGVWEGVIYKYGVDPTVAYNVTDYPFPRHTQSSRADKATLALLDGYQKPGLMYGPRPASLAMCSICGESLCAPAASAAGPCQPCPPTAPAAPGAGPQFPPLVAPICPPATAPAAPGAGPVTQPPAVTPPAPPSAPATQPTPETKTPGPVYK